MEVKCRLNGENITLHGEPTARLRDVLYHTGCYSVRDSDDAEGFAGSDTIIFNGQLKYSNFILLYQAEGAEIRTAESLLEKGELNYVQKAMVAAGIVQSAYNAPAAALILTWLLEKHPNPTRQQIKDVLTSIFIRDAGYEHYYLAVKLACELRDEGEFKTEIAPSFRPQLDIIGKPAGKIDGAALVSGEPVFVEDKVPANAWCLHVLRSPFASAYIKSIDTSEAEKLDGVAAIITAENCPDVYYMQAGQGTPEPSPHDRRLFNWKVRHVGDRVAGIVARTPEIADKAASLIKVEYEPTEAVFTVVDDPFVVWVNLTRFSFYPYATYRLHWEDGALQTTRGANAIGGSASFSTIDEQCERRGAATAPVLCKYYTVNQRQLCYCFNLF